MGNTVGRSSKAKQLELAYIAGFLDGDGSIMLQLHRQNKGGYINNMRVKTVICFYQDAKYRTEIEWIRESFGYGYVYTRNDHICELRIEGFQRVFDTLMKLVPYLRFKKRQAKLLIELIPKLQQKVLSKNDLAVWIQKMREYNYFSAQRNALEIPVTTEVSVTGTEIVQK